MIAALLFGFVAIAYGVTAHNGGEAFLGLFFIGIVLIDVVPGWVRHELRLWRRVVRHDFDQAGLERVDDRRVA